MWWNACFINHIGKKPLKLCFLLLLKSTSIAALVCNWQLHQLNQCPEYVIVMGHLIFIQHWSIASLLSAETYWMEITTRFSIGAFLFHKIPAYCSMHLFTAFTFAASKLFLGTIHFVPGACWRVGKLTPNPLWFVTTTTSLVKEAGLLSLPCSLSLFIYTTS